MRIRHWLERNSLWAVGLGLMLASSGIDGAYMARWMPASWLGYVLNTTADVAGEVLMYWFGRLQQEPKNTKRHRLSWAVLAAEAVAVGYSWFFGWRQLLLVLPAVEGQAARWVAPVAAAFVPLMLAGVGYAQALLVGRLDNERQGSARCDSTGATGDSVGANVTPTGAPPLHTERQPAGAGATAGVTVANTGAQTDSLAPTERRDQLAALWAGGDERTFEQLGTAFGVSRQTVSRDFSVLEEAGRVKRNSSGEIKVIS